MAGAPFVADRSQLFPLAEGWYLDHAAEVLRGVSVAGLDPARHELTLTDGHTLGYAKVLLATGSTPRALDLPGFWLREGRGRPGWR